MISHYRTSAPCTTRRNASPTPRCCFLWRRRDCATNWSCFTRPHAGQGVGAVDRTAGYDFIRTGLAFETHGAASGVWLEHLGFGSMRGLCTDAPCCDLRRACRCRAEVEARWFLNRIATRISARRTTMDQSARPDATNMGDVAVTHLARFGSEGQFFRDTMKKAWAGIEFPTLSQAFVNRFGIGSALTAY